MVGPEGFHVAFDRPRPPRRRRLSDRDAAPRRDVFHLSGEFLEVDPPDRLSYTFRWEEPTPDDRETVVTLSLREVDGSTNVVLDQGSFATEERLVLHTQGWTDSLDRLYELVASRRTV